MTYAEVVRARGYPPRVGTRQGYGCFVYGSGDAVWFYKGQVVEVHGRQLEQNRRRFEDYQQLVGSLGEPQPSEFRLRFCWPRQGLFAWITPSRTIERFSLCRAWSPYSGKANISPWANDLRGGYQLDGLSPGWGREYLPWFGHRQVVLSASGHVIRIRGRHLKNSFQIGYHDFSRGDLEVGQPPRQNVFGLKWKLPDEGVFREDNLTVEMQGGLVRSLELRLDPSMVEALGGEAPRGQPGAGGPGL